MWDLGDSLHRDACIRSRHRRGLQCRSDRLSLLIAVSITAAGLGMALLNLGSWTSLLGGAAVGGGIAAMHYTGMMALELPGRITWAPGLVLASVTFGIVFGAIAVFFAARRDDWVNTATAVILLTLAIVSMHFTGMGAVLVMPDPTRFAGTWSLAPASLSLVIAGATAIILGISLVAALSDRQSKRKLQQQKVLLDTALENMSQGLCMFAARWPHHGCSTIVTPKCWACRPLRSGARSLLDVVKRRNATSEIVAQPGGVCRGRARRGARRKIQHTE